MRVLLFFGQRRAVFSRQRCLFQAFSSFLCTILYEVNENMSKLNDFQYTATYFDGRRFDTLHLTCSHEFQNKWYADEQYGWKTDPKVTHGSVSNSVVSLKKRL